MDQNIETFISFTQNTVIGQIVVLTFIILVVWVVGRILLDKLIRKIIATQEYSDKLERQKRQDTIVRVFMTLLNVFIVVSAVLGLLMIIGVNLVGIVAGAGVLGVAVGIGLQGVIKDYTTGFFILFENQFRKGDIVGFSDIGDGSIGGVVEEVNLRTTKLRDLDGNVHIIPNGSMTSVTNRSFGYANVNINLDVAYDSDIDDVEKVVNEVGAAMVKSDSPLKGDIYEPIKFLRVDSFEASSVRIKALGKVKPAKQWAVAGAFRREIKSAFKKNNIEIPFDQLVVQEKK